MSDMTPIHDIFARLFSLPGQLKLTFAPTGSQAPVGMPPGQLEPQRSIGVSVGQEPVQTPQQLINTLNTQLLALSSAQESALQEVIHQGTLLEQKEAEVVTLRAEREQLLARIAELEERLNTSSRNSSRPASQDRPDQRPPRTRQGSLPDGQKRSRGGQPGHQGHHRPLLDMSKVDEVIQVPPPASCTCEGEVVPTGTYYRTQQYDLPPITLEIKEYQLGIGICQNCGKVHQAALPAEVVPGMLGCRLLALVTLLEGAYQISRRGVCSVIEALSGLHVSPGALSEADARVSDALAEPYREAAAAVQESEAANCDETGSRREGKRSWVWLMASATLAVFLVSASRGKVAYEKLVGQFKGWLTSDRWHTYNGHPPGKRQLCWAHLLRDIQKLIDRGGQSAEVGEKLMAEAVKMFEFWQQFKQEVLTRERLKEVLIQVRVAFESALLEGAALEKAPKTRTFCRNLLSLKEALWNFIDHEGLGPTNNRGEQLIRQVVLWRKRSFGTWSERGDHHLERLMTTVVTLRLQNCPVLPWLTEAIRAYYAHTPAPSLLPKA